MTRQVIRQLSESISQALDNRLATASSYVPMLLVVIALSLTGGCGQEPSQQDQVTIGAILPLTGDKAAWGTQARDGIDFALYRQSEMSPRIRVDYQDSQGEPRMAATAARALTGRARLPAIIGDMTSATTLAAAPVCQQARVVLLSPVASSPLITDAGSFIYRIWPSDLFEAGFTAQWLKDRQYSRIAVVHISDEFGVPLAEAFSEACPSDIIVTTLSYLPDTENFRPLLFRLQEHEPDAVYLISHYTDAARFLRQAHTSGRSFVVVGTASLKNDVFVQQAGSSAHGVFFPSRKGFSASSENQDVRAFVEDFNTKYGRSPGLVEAQAFDAAQLLIAAIDHGARTGEEIKQFFDALPVDGFDGVTGPIRFDENGDLVSADFHMLTVRDGRFIDAE